MIVAIDGPAGSGKGTITEIVSKELNLVNISSGGAYRCVALLAIQNNLEVAQKEEILNILNNSKIEFKNENGKDLVYLNGEDVTDRIREKDVAKIVSQISSIKEVRFKLNEIFRQCAKDKNVIMEGRDIGTYVFPNADVKIYLDAEPEERARRRQKQNEEAGIQSTYEEVLAGIIARDENDKNKEMGALKVAEDAIVVDGTHGTIEENVQKVIEIINKKKLKNNETKSVGIDTSINQKKEKNNKTKSVGARCSVPKKNKTRKNNRKIKGNQKRTPIKNNTKRNRKKHTMGIIQNSI